MSATNETYKRSATIRYDTISGTVPFDGFLMDTGEASFVEWNNGEGIDIEFYDETYNLTKRLSLCDDEIHMIALIAKMLDRLDIDKLKSDKKKYLKEANDRHELIKNFAANYK